MPLSTARRTTSTFSCDIARYLATWGTVPAALALEAVTRRDPTAKKPLLIDAGANPKAIQTFMGHSKIQTTFDIYGHLMPGSHNEVRERMDAYLLSAAAKAVERPSERVEEPA